MEFPSLVLGLLFLNLGNVIAKCGNFDKQNSSKVIQWIIRRVQGYEKCVVTSIGIGDTVIPGEQKLIMENETWLDVYISQSALSFTKCIIIISDKVIVMDESMNHGYNHVLQIIFQEDTALHQNHLGK
ncbi:uncharacterized protein LOC111715987 [Eurytemora carolleeae]|uniref:uncharacterized protein LOC111715987 n=1 Tax=Eurytemora carolleeae TaxID=1294199 RepID=UPI000C78209A|nr:uncharacterized protein LOC111715987 [Eurytemora carolleeae]|eukprot:XP_023347165.1 uncharacterized protein LOC111715987 [Eurytemora affinis]